VAVKVVRKEKCIGRVNVVNDDGTVTETEEVVDEIVVDKPMANVGLKVGMTKNMGDFNSLRVDVSLFLPSELDKKSLDRTFKRADKWCEKKMKNIQKEL